MSKFHVQRCTTRQDGQYLVTYRNSKGEPQSAVSLNKLDEGQPFILESNGTARAVEVRG